MNTNRLSEKFNLPYERVREFLKRMGHWKPNDRIGGRYIEPQMEDVKRRIKEGESLQQISEDLGVSTSVLYRLRKKYNLVTSKRRLISEEEQNNIIEEYLTR